MNETKSSGRRRLTTDEALLRYSLDLIRRGRFRSGAVGLQMLWDRERRTGEVDELLRRLQDEVGKMLGGLGDASGPREPMHLRGASHDGTQGV